MDSVGCPHCDNHDVVRWVRRALCRATAASLSADVQRLDENAVAILRMKDKWAAQTEALIEGVSTAKSSAAMRRALHDGVSLATPVSGGSGRR
jgi:hypothetical protein